MRLIFDRIRLSSLQMGHDPASCIISYLALGSLSLNLSQYLTGMRLSFSPHNTRHWISWIALNPSGLICVVVLFLKDDSNACLAPGYSITCSNKSTPIGRSLEGEACISSSTLLIFSYLLIGLISIAAA